MAVRFTRSCAVPPGTQYVPGDVAGFAPEIEARLVAQEVAAPWPPPPVSDREAATVTPAVVPPDVPEAAVVTPPKRAVRPRPKGRG